MDTKNPENNGETSIDNFKQYEIIIKQEFNIPELLEKTKKSYDFCMIGKITDRNKPIIETLRSQYFRVDHIPDPEDHARIAKSFIILNVHQDDTKEYNSNLLDKWLCDGITILSEECSSKLDDKIKIATLENFIKKAIKLLGSNRLPQYKIGLCMIVKDESHIIHESLEATLPFIDTFSILDTGSTDNTVQIIRDFYAKHNIQGKVTEGDWKGFGKSRSESMLLCDDLMDYIIVMDADDLMGGPPNSKEFLRRMLYMTNPNACNIQIRRGALEYERTQIFKARDNWRYVGVLHEYPTNDKKNNVMVQLPREIYMVGRTMGARSKIDGNKYKRDAEVLLKELELEPKNDRYMFYLAQSYRDAGMYDEAIEWYKKRFEFGGWVEEQFICALNLTRLMRSKEWAWKAHELCPNRSESLVSYMAHCRMNAMWSRELLSMALYASSIPKPQGVLLFLETDNYEWRVWDELSTISFFCGAVDLSKQTFMKLIKENKYPPEQDERIRKNFKIILEAMQQKR
jgi:glycosyltransferase involved in cell wall biosynthesis